MSLQNVIRIDTEVLQELVSELRRRPGVAELPRKAEYELFRGTIEGRLLVVYSTGKIVLEQHPNVTSVLESLLLRRTVKTQRDLVIGSDEAGKGEWLGPMVVGAVAVTPTLAVQLQLEGVMDSKELSLTKVRSLARKIADIAIATKFVIVSPSRFNELFEELKDQRRTLNHLVAWGHRVAIEDVISKISATRGRRITVAIDEFDRREMERELMKIPNYRELTFANLPRAEEALAVAASGIVARATREDWLDNESSSLGIDLRKLDPTQAKKQFWFPRVAKLAYLYRVIKP